MARRGSAYLQQLLRSFKDDYRDKNWSYNGVLVPNKVVERYPDTVFIYNRLQVMILEGWSSNRGNVVLDVKAARTQTTETAEALEVLKQLCRPLPPNTPLLFFSAMVLMVMTLIMMVCVLLINPVTRKVYPRDGSAQKMLVLPH